MSAAHPDAEREAAADRLITAALDALSVADPDALSDLITDDVVIETDRRRREGVAEAREWAAHRYDHLDRRYRITKLSHKANGSVLDACVEYLWRGAEDVVDSSPVTFHFEITGELISRIRLED